jgi:hypothetical protein
VIIASISSKNPIYRFYLVVRSCAAVDGLPVVLRGAAEDRLASEDVVRAVRDTYLSGQ